MKQIDTCLDRFFNNQTPLQHKWQATRHPQYSQLLLLFHYHHLVLVYDLQNKMALYQWWELPADKRGLDAALNYLAIRDLNPAMSEQMSFF